MISPLDHAHKLDDFGVGSGPAKSIEHGMNDPLD
jgi:hypothetical protein